MNAALKLTVAIVAALGVTLAGCATVPKRISRDTQTYTAEVLASLAREEAAAEALTSAAAQARAAGDEMMCRELYAPAHLIDVKARAQAFRALWLAGLPYPLPDGSLPAADAEQDDPGPGGAVDDMRVVSFCLDTVLDPEADPEGLEVAP